MKTKQTTWIVKAFDIEGRSLAVFTPSFVGPLCEAMEWLSSLDWLHSNPNIVRVELSLSV